MTFSKILSDHSCDCLEDTTEDTATLYAIKTMKENLRIQDFNSYWEKGMRPSSQDCEETCSLKGLSVSVFEDNTKNEVMDIYKELFPLAPKYKPYLTIIKFYNSSGVVKHTPTEVNKHHYDFYKCDTFEFLNIEVLQVNELHKCLS